MTLYSEDVTFFSGGNRNRNFTESYYLESRNRKSVSVD